MDIDNQCISVIKKNELSFIKSINIISLGIALLFIFGYAWNYSYYTSIGIPPQLIEYKFPEILLPKSSNIASFLVQFVLTIIASAYYSFYAEYRKKLFAHKLGLKTPLGELNKYLFSKNKTHADKSNCFVFCTYLKDYIDAKQKESSEFIFDSESFFDGIKKYFPDLEFHMVHDFVKYTLHIFLADKKILNETIGVAAGVLPSGYKIYEIIYRCALFLLMPVYGIIMMVYGTEYFWHLLFMILGVLSALGVIKMSYIYDRFQYWHTILMVGAFFVFLNMFDGRIHAKNKQALDRLPVIKIETLSNIPLYGLLFASFENTYIISPITSDTKTQGTIIVINKDDVKSAQFMSQDKFIINASESNESI